MEYKTMLQEERAEFLFVLAPTFDILGVHIANEVNKNLSNKFLRARRQFGCSCPVPLFIYVPDSCYQVMGGSVAYW